jgi:hypothetical protein
MARAEIGHSSNARFKASVSGGWSTCPVRNFYQLAPGMLLAWKDLLWRCASPRSILFLTSAIILAVLSAGNPLALFAKATASIVGSSAALRSDEIALFSKTGNQAETEISKQAAEALLEQFRVWAATEDARARVQQPRGPTGSDSQAWAAKPARAEAKPPQTNRHISSAHKARGEVRFPKQHARRQGRHRQYALVKDWWAPIGPGLHFGWLVRLDWEPFAGLHGSRETRRRRFGMLPFMAHDGQGSMLRYITAPHHKA